jgi:hypothetical protein
VLGTPVIDPSSNTLYLVADSQVGNTGTPGQDCPNKHTPPSSWVHRLHAIDLSSGNFGNEKYNGPVEIPSITIGQATFQSQAEIQRPGLLLTHEIPIPSYPTVYIAFSMMDTSTSQPSGWIFAYDAQNLPAQAFPLAYATVPGILLQNDPGGGIWAGGAGLAAGTDENGGNYLYFSTANGYFDLNSGSADTADSFIKLQTNLQPASGTNYFTPSDQLWRQMDSSTAC